MRFLGQVSNPEPPESNIKAIPTSMGNDLLLPDFELREIFLRQPYRVYSKSCSAVGEKIIVSELESLLHYKIKCNFKLMKPFLMNELQRGFCQTLRIVCGQQTTSLKKRR
jgi:hypothetical protein